MHTNSGAPYQIERTGSHSSGFGAGFIVTHRATQTGALKASLEAACRWMDSDAAYRRARAERDARKDEHRLAMAIGLEAVKRRLSPRDFTTDYSELPVDLRPIARAAREHIANDHAPIAG